MINAMFRARHDDPGLHEAEAGFIRLLDKLTNGSKVGKKHLDKITGKYYQTIVFLQIEVNETGTSLTYQPGSLLGGRVEHQCALTRGVSYSLC